MRTSTWLAGLVLTIGCGKQLNPEFCLHNPSDTDCYDAGLVFLDAAPPCTSNTSCTEPGLGVCDTSRGTCVQCTTGDFSACTGATDRCSSEDTCVGCTQDDQCSSHLCLLAGGTCAPVGHVLFVTTNGTGDCRLSTTPCEMQVALTTARADALVIGYMGDVIHMAGGDYATGPYVLDVPYLTIVTAAAQTVTVTDADVDGAVFAVTKGPVEIDDLTVQNARNADAITCANSALALNHVIVQTNPKNGLSASNCDITIDRSTFTGNNDSAIYLDDGTLSIHHNFIYKNGNDQLQAAAVSLHGHAGGEFKFNTVAFNSAEQQGHEGVAAFGNGTDYAAGLECANDHGVSARDSLFADNNPATFATDPFKNACGNVYQFAILNWIGAANTVKFASSTDLHLTAQTPNTGNQQSPAIRDNANTSCGSGALKHDIDNDLRPLNNACDYGADEYNSATQP